MLRTFNIYSFAFVIAITVLVSGANAQQPNVDEEGLPVANEQDKSPTGEDSLDLQLLAMIGDVQDRQEVIEMLLDGGVTPAEQNDFTKELLALSARIKKLEDLLENLPKDHEGQDIDLGPYKKAIKKLRATDVVHTEAIEGLLESYGSLYTSLVTLEDLYGDHELRITDLEEADTSQDGLITVNVERSTQNELDIAAMMSNRTNFADLRVGNKFLGVGGDQVLFLYLIELGLTVPLTDWAFLSATFTVGDLGSSPFVGGGGEIAFDVLQEYGATLSSVLLGLGFTVGDIRTDGLAYKSHILVLPDLFLRVGLWDNTVEIGAQVGAAVFIDADEEAHPAFQGGGQLIFNIF